jgi:hypothetical protein
MNYTNVVTNNYCPVKADLSGLKINLRLVNYFLGLTLAAGFLSFLIVNNDLAVQSFILKDLKAKTVELNSQNKELEVRTTSLNSYQYLSQKVAVMQMVPVENAVYLSADKVFAKR